MVLKLNLNKNYSFIMTRKNNFMNQKLIFEFQKSLINLVYCPPRGLIFNINNEK